MGRLDQLILKGASLSRKELFPCIPQYARTGLRMNGTDRVANGHYYHLHMYFISNLLRRIDTLRVLRD
jgi:hypothetical protein